MLFPTLLLLSKTVLYLLPVGGFQPSSLKLKAPRRATRSTAAPRKERGPSSCSVLRAGDVVGTLQQPLLLASLSPKFRAVQERLRAALFGGKEPTVTPEIVSLKMLMLKHLVEEGYFKEQVDADKLLQTREAKFSRVRALEMDRLFREVHEDVLEIITEEGGEKLQQKLSKLRRAVIQSGKGGFLVGRKSLRNVERATHLKWEDQLDYAWKQPLGRSELWEDQYDEYKEVIEETTELPFSTYCEQNMAKDLFPDSSGETMDATYDGPKDSRPPPTMTLTPNYFPYFVEARVIHYALWMYPEAVISAADEERSPCKLRMASDEEVAKELQKRFGLDAPPTKGEGRDEEILTADFTWWENPLWARSVPCVRHLQVMRKVTSNFLEVGATSNILEVGAQV